LRILLTGAGGFVGANLAAVLATTPSAHLFAADLRPPDAETLSFLSPAAAHITWLPLDVRDRTALAGVLAAHAITDIVHGAAVTVGPAGERARAAEIVDVNLGGTLNLLLAAAAAPSVARVLVLSSSGVYAVPPGEAPGSAAGPLAAGQPEDGPLDLHNLYSITKYSAELLAARLGALCGKPMAAVRLSAIYGPHERPRATRPGTSAVHRLMGALQARRPVTVAGGAVSRDWTYAEDAGRAVQALLLAPAWRWGVYNVSCGQATPFAAVVAAFAAHGLAARWVDPPAADPAGADPASASPASASPAGASPASADPAGADPAGAGPASADPAGADPPNAGPAGANPPAPGVAEIAMHPGQARTPLDITRLRADTGFVPAYTVPQGLAAWLAAEPLPPAG
jgi:nucleoside-diphosphate-sugar epimerase